MEECWGELHRKEAETVLDGNVDRAEGKKPSSTQHRKGRRTISKKRGKSVTLQQSTLFPPSFTEKRRGVKAKKTETR